MTAARTRKSTTTAPPPSDTDTPRSDREEQEAGHISTTQMRRLHALLRDHGITGDKTVHDYLNTWLREHDQDPIESRSDLHQTQAVRIIADLEEAEVAHAPTAAALRDLRAPFDEEAIGRLPRSTCGECSKNRGVCNLHPSKARCQTCGNWHNTQATIHIDFVGHADVTARLLEVDPFWSWRMFTAEEFSTIPPEMRKGLWIMLTVCGVSRPGFGDSEGGKGPKEAIGDALRNAAMRFGVALDLWAKGDRQWAHTEKHGAEDAHPDQAPPRAPQQDPPPPAYDGPDVATLLARIDNHAVAAGKTYEEATHRMRTALAQARAGREDVPPLTVAELETVPPELIASWEQQMAAHLRDHPPVAPTGDTTGDPV